MLIEFLTEFDAMMPFEFQQQGNALQDSGDCSHEDHSMAMDMDGIVKETPMGLGPEEEIMCQRLSPPSSTPPATSPPAASTPPTPPRSSPLFLFPFPLPNSDVEPLGGPQEDSGKPQVLPLSSPFNSWPSSAMSLQASPPLTLTLSPASSRPLLVMSL
ncbi:hypothetical protein E1B28_003287 [Marasmius oreades]|uniref:Uncharacterized protein n=1 Tax=Marasmius oreades TaxID=181124 RepID=A0A9P7UNA0_9AGAR|nr:uncharacterized protein E1B28_003287 [Marasmius oreades]KAG7085744.1 hypothetical protein E1B28_003287 [Marasmius oreades]